MKSSVKAVSKPSIAPKKVESSESTDSDSSSSDEDDKNVNLPSIFILSYFHILHLTLAIASIIFFHAYRFAAVSL